MQWQSWSEFWHMGGNAWFVWGSYGLMLALLVLELLQTRSAGRSTLRRLLRWHKATTATNTPAPRGLTKNHGSSS